MLPMLLFVPISKQIQFQFAFYVQNNLPYLAAQILHLLSNYKDPTRLNRPSHSVFHGFLQPAGDSFYKDAVSKCQREFIIGQFPRIGPAFKIVSIS